MLRRFSTIFILSFLLVAFMAMTAFAARTAEEHAKKLDYKVAKSVYYAYPDETIGQSGSSSSAVGTSTYSKSSNSASPGVAIGDTWYDYQHNGTIGRMIDWGMNTDTVIVHFSWMRLPGPSFTDRHYAYTAFDGKNGALAGVTAVQPAGDYAGYVGVAVSNANKAVIGGHNNIGGVGLNQTHIYWDGFPGFGFFIANSRVPDATASFGAAATQAVIWPKYAYQEGTDIVTHVIAQVSAPAAADPQAIYYFRKVGDTSSGTWDFPPYVIDTIYDLSHDIVAEKNGNKVAMAWTANLTYISGSTQHPAGFQDDTLSGTSPIQVQWDNDMYYQISTDQGQNWANRVNITKNRLGEVGYRPYTDLSTTIDAAGNFHLVWSAVPWPEDPASDGWDTYYCRMFHYSENWPVIRTVASAEWSADTLLECVPGAWNIAMSKMQISECDNKIYVLWAQHGDGANDIFDDCAARANGGDGEAVGSSNAELFLGISSDGGLTWDAPRNLTNSYSKDCDPANGGLDCDSDNWPSMTRYGRQNVAGEDWSAAVVVDPSGAYLGDWYLDVQYIHDIDAGGIVQNEGTWQNSDVNWFRLACVEPVPNPQFLSSISEVTFPTWAKPGATVGVDLSIENAGNEDLTYATTIEMDNDAGLNWLNVSGLGALVPAGLSNIVTGTITLGSGTTVNGGYVGRLIFTGNAPTSPDTIPIAFVVADTVVAPEFDTVSSACLSLIVANTGNFGNSGNGGAGTVNMDWINGGPDCDTTALTYLYDGSPVVAWIDGVDTVANWAIFDGNWLDARGFYPLGGQCSGSETNYNWYSTGTFVTRDSTIGMEKAWFGSTDPGNCDFIIQKLKVWSYDGLAKSGLVVGEAIDWDIPSDSGAQNNGGFTPAANLVYQVGSEYGVDTVCQDSDTRFGGIAFFQAITNGGTPFLFHPNAYTARNDSDVFPAGNFVPADLYTDMVTKSGLSLEPGTNTDLHIIMTFDNNLSLNPGDTVEYWTVLATVENGTAADLETAIANGKAFITANSYLPYSCGGTTCCVGPIRGNVDGIGAIDIADLVYFVEFSFAGGPAPPCTEEADMDASGGLDIADIVYLVEYSFAGGPAPLPCP